MIGISPLSHATRKVFDGLLGELRRALPRDVGAGEVLLLLVVGHGELVPEDRVVGGGGLEEGVGEVPLPAVVDREFDRAGEGRGGEEEKGRKKENRREENNEPKS